jgi:glycosyltransferase involved in cell wall biosynthesis
MPSASRIPIDVVLPVHNEAASIEATLREYREVTQKETNADVRFVVSEDGSKDGSPELLKKLSAELPIHLITGPERKGYSRAVVDGFRATQSDIVGFIDSDGQCDPRDLAVLLKEIDSYDLVIGYRNPRKDHWIRILMSGAFGTVYRMLFPITLRDPSCPYLLIKRPSLLKILEGKVGVLKQGFWWEFNARAKAAGLKIKEVPVAHRVRAAGETQVYKPTKVPGIAYEHICGLFTLRAELKAIRDKTGR